MSGFLLILLSYDASYIIKVYTVPGFLERTPITVAALTLLDELQATLSFLEIKVQVLFSKVCML